MSHDFNIKLIPQKAANVFMLYALGRRRRSRSRQICHLCTANWCGPWLASSWGGLTYRLSVTLNPLSVMDAVSALLVHRIQRALFLIPVFECLDMILQLEWWEAALSLNDGMARLYINNSGMYEVWALQGAFGEEVLSGIVQVFTDACPFGGGWCWGLNKRDSSGCLRKNVTTSTCSKRRLCYTVWCVFSGAESICFSPIASGHGAAVFAVNEVLKCAIVIGSAADFFGQERRLVA
jgi:hypothetical protein